MSRFKDKPTPEYLEAVRALAKLSITDANAAFADAVAGRIRDGYVKRLNGATEHGGHVCFERLAGARRCPNRGDNPCWSPYGVGGMDHLSEWRSAGATTAIVSQPYGFGLETMREMVALCDERGFTLWVDAGRSWHYPGRTVAVAYTRRR